MRELLCPPPPVRLLLLAGLGNAFFQQATGVEAAVYHTPETLEAVGITEERSLLLATVGGSSVTMFTVSLAFLGFFLFGPDSLPTLRHSPTAERGLPYARRPRPRFTTRSTGPR